MSLVNEGKLEWVFQQVAEGRMSVGIKELEEFLGCPVRKGKLPDDFFLSEFIDAFDSEMKELCSRENYLRTQVRELVQEKEKELELYDEAVAGETFTPDGLDRDSYFELLVIQARNLPEIVDFERNPYCAIRLNEKVMHRTALIKNSGCPVWNEKLRIPVNSKGSQISIEIYYENLLEVPVCSLKIALEDYEDQCIRCVWTNLESSLDSACGEIKLAGQWVHNFIKYYELNLRNQEISLLKCSAELRELSEKRVSLLDLEGKSLLRAWLKPTRPRRRCAQSRMSLLSLSSVCTSPSILDQELCKLRDSLTKIECSAAVPRACPRNFFFIGARARN